MCIKAKSQQNYPGNNFGEAGSEQARKRLGSLRLHPAQDLGGGKVRSKRKTHHLSEKMVAQRQEKGLSPSQASHPQQME